MIEFLMHGVLDTLKIIPFLFITFLLLEYLEHKLNRKSEKLLVKNKKYGPILGGLLGAIPQCGFGTMAASLFSNKIITIITIITIHYIIFHYIIIN